MGPNKRSRVVVRRGAAAIALLLGATSAWAQNRAAFPTEPSGPPRQPAAPQPPPQPQPPPPPPQAPPAQPQPPPSYPPQQYPPQQYPPQQYPPQQYPPQQYPPQQYPPQAPQYPYGYGQQPAPQPDTSQGFPPPTHAPQPGAAPGFPQPGYPNPYGQPQPPPEPQNPALSPDGRYRQVLGTYQRPNYPTAASQNGVSASNDYIKLRDRHKRRHDGFYFRFGLGVGRGHDSMTTAVPIPTDRDLTFAPTPFEGSGTATSPVTELAVGYTVGAGVTLGVGSYTVTVPKLTTESVQTETGPYVFHLSQFALIGPVLDWYFDDEGGFHAEAAPGVATYVAGAGEPKREGPQAQAHTAVGFGFMLGVGYDWWISDTWSLGLLARVTYGTMDGTAPTPVDNGVDFHHTAFAPAVLVTATYQ